MTYADRIPLTRPVPTTRHRLDDARSHALEVERDDLRIQVGREQADNRAMMRDRDQALAERDEARNDAKLAAQLADFRQGVIDRHRQELGAAGDVLAVVRDAAERIDRALAVYDTTPAEGSVTITLDNSAGTFTPRHPGDALADALRNAYTAEHLGLLHERVVDLLDDDTPREDPMGRLVDALFAARHKPTQPGLGSPPPRAQDEQAERLARALGVCLAALSGAARMCRYHGADFERLGMEHGEPRCDSCKQPWRVNRALAAIEAAEREG